MSSGFAIEGARVACMATFPARHATLPAVVASLAPQVDRLFIYANETTEGLPPLDAWPNVTVLDSRNHAGDLSANGKIFPTRFLRDCTVFTVDDDFIYPRDYVSRYLGVFEAFGGRCCVATHGSVFPERPRWYYERCQVFSAVQALQAAQLATLAGSGTFAFRQSSLRLDPDDFLGEVMVDLKLSLAAAEQELPIWCVARPKSWLRPLTNQGLWEQYRRRITHHTHEIRRHDWSFARYREIALRALEGLEGGGFRIDPELERALGTGEPPSAWRRSRVSYGRRAEHLELLEELDAAAG